MNDFFENIATECFTFFLGSMNYIPLSLVEFLNSYVVSVVACFLIGGLCVLHLS